MDIKLDKIKRKDMKDIYKWHRDSEFLKYYDYYPPIPQSEGKVDKTFKYYASSDKAEAFAIRKGEQIIGIGGFDDIIIENKLATLFIGFGEEGSRGKGYGTKAMDLLLNYGFSVLNLHRIQLQVLEFNGAAIALYEKCGFKKEGVFREFVLRGRERYDLLLYGLLKDEWLSSKDFNEFQV